MPTYRGTLATTGPTLDGDRFSPEALAAMALAAPKAPLTLMFQQALPGRVLRAALVDGRLELELEVEVRLAGPLPFHLAPGGLTNKVRIERGTGFRLYEDFELKEVSLLPTPVWSELEPLRLMPQPGEEQNEPASGSG